MLAQNGAVASQGGVSKPVILIHDSDNALLQILGDDFTALPTTVALSGVYRQSMCMPTPTDVQNLYFMTGQIIKKMNMETKAVTTVIDLSSAIQSNDLFVTEKLGRIVTRSANLEQIQVRNLSGTLLSSTVASSGIPQNDPILPAINTTVDDTPFFFDRMYHDGSQWQYPAMYAYLANAGVAYQGATFVIPGSAKILGWSYANQIVLRYAGQLWRQDGSVIVNEPYSIIDAKISKDRQYVFYTTKTYHDSYIWFGVKKVRISDGAVIWYREVGTAQNASTRDYYVEQGIFELPDGIVVMEAVYNTDTGTKTKAMIHKVALDGASHIGNTNLSPSANYLCCTNINL